MDNPPKHPDVAAIFGRLLSELGLSANQLAAQLATSQQAISNYVIGRNKPGGELLAAIVTRYPAINSAWLLTGKGEPFPNGRALTPAPSAPVLLHSGAATVAEAENILLREQVADLKSDKVRLLQENEQLRGKSSDNPDAAGSPPAAPSKPKPGVIGFRLAVSRRAGNRGKAAPAGLS